MPFCGARMSMRCSWSIAVTLRSTSSEILARMSASSLATSLRAFWSIWMICSSISEIFPFACATVAMSCPRSPSIRAASRSSAVTRLIGIRFFCQRSRTPSSSFWMNSISFFLAAAWSV